MNIKQGISNYRFLPMFLTLFVGILIAEVDIKTKLSDNFNYNCNYYFYINNFFLNLKNIKQKKKKYYLNIGFSGILGGLSTFYAPLIITF